jgi:hypothetical protein
MGWIAKSRKAEVNMARVKTARAILFRLSMLACVDGLTFVASCMPRCLPLPKTKGLGGFS